MVRPLIDCPNCACLIDTRESACPFCGVTVRRAEGWSALGLGFIVGLATAACGDKTGTTDDASTSSTSSSSSSDGTTGTSDGETTVDSMVPTTTFAEGSAYAGPDANESSTDDPSAGTDNTDTGSETGTGTSTGTGTDTGGDTANDTFPGTSAYAGPDVSDTATPPLGT